MASTKKRGFSTLATLNDGDTDGLDVASRPTKRTKSRKNKKAAAAAAAAAETTSHNLSSLDDDDPEFVLITDHNKLKKQFNDLYTELQSQKKIVADLKSRLSSIMSLLDINDATSADQCSSAISNFAAAVKRPTAVTAAADRNVHETVIAAVYVDNQRRLNRATNLVITGLSASAALSDQQAVVELCSSEFNEVPEIIYSKRLGKPLAGRIQPLLVVLKSADQATRVLSFAKLLRQSTNEYTRRNVFISANLTKAEARAAYEMRCERRRTAERRTIQLRSQPVSQPVVQQQPHLIGQGQQQVQMPSSPHNMSATATQHSSCSVTLGGPRTPTPVNAVNGSINNFLPTTGGQLLVLDTSAPPHHLPAVVNPPTYLCLPSGPQQPTQWYIDQQNQQQLQLQQSWQQPSQVGSQHSGAVAQHSQNAWQQQAWHHDPLRHSTSQSLPSTQKPPV